jgi:adenosylmethionine-8-amino-7-oxononanoate aminotransferase
MCGMGRTGHRFACEADGIAPDLLFLAKGLGAGYQPIGALLIHERIAAAVEKGSGRFMHGHTYMAHATACAAALAVQQVIERDGLVEKVERQGRVLMSALERRLGQHPHIGDIRGRGLFIALEFVRDRASKEPFAPEHQVHMRVQRAAMEEGLLVYPMGGTMDGRRGNHILLAPPFILGDAELDAIAESTARAVAPVLEAA